MLLRRWKLEEEEAGRAEASGHIIPKFGERAQSVRDSTFAILASRGTVVSAQPNLFAAQLRSLVALYRRCADCMQRSPSNNSAFQHDTDHSLAYSSEQKQAGSAGAEVENVVDVKG